MAGFTTRDFKASTPAETPDPQRMQAAVSHLIAARLSLLRAARELDASPTRRIHRDTQGLMDSTDNLLVNLTEWVS